MRICRKYGMNERGRVYNLQSGHEVPLDEPLMLFRAKDRCMPEMLLRYLDLCQNPEHKIVAQDKINEVVSWQQKNLDVVHEPDTDIDGYYTDGLKSREPEEDVMGGGERDTAAPQHDHQFDPMSYARGILKMHGPRIRLWDVTVHGPDICSRHVRVISTGVDDRGYLHVDMENDKRATYNNSEWSVIEKTPRGEDA